MKNSRVYRRQNSTEGRIECVDLELDISSSSMHRSNHTNNNNKPSSKFNQQQHPQRSNLRRSYSTVKNKHDDHLHHHHHKQTRKQQHYSQQPNVVTFECHFMIPPNLLRIIQKFILPILIIIYVIISCINIMTNHHHDHQHQFDKHQIHTTYDSSNSRRMNHGTQHQYDNINHDISSISNIEQNINVRNYQQQQQFAYPNSKNILKQQQFYPPERQSLPTPVRLLRIPKAGSSSFSSFLRYQYNCTSNEFPPGDCTKQNRKSCSMVQGCYNHKDLPDWKSMIQQQQDQSLSSSSTTVWVPMMTFIREPVARYISAYQYKGHHGLGTHGNITLHTILFPEYDNTQTNYLSRNPIGTWGNVQNQKLANRARIIPPTDIISDEEWNHRLQESIDFIVSEHLVFLGILEYWDDSLRLFCRMFICNTELLHISLHSKPERQHESKAISSSSSTQTNIIHNDYTHQYSNVSLHSVQKSNAIDTRLYHIAIQRFCSDLLQFQNDISFISTIQNSTIQLCSNLQQQQHSLTGTTIQ